MRFHFVLILRIRAGHPAGRPGEPLSQVDSVLPAGPSPVSPGQTAAPRLTDSPAPLPGPRATTPVSSSPQLSAQCWGQEFDQGPWETPLWGLSGETAEVVPHVPLSERTAFPAFPNENIPTCSSAREGAHPAPAGPLDPTFLFHCLLHHVSPSTCLSVRG